MKKIIFLLATVLLLFNTFTFSSFASPASEIVYENNFDSGAIDESFDIYYGNLKVVEEKGEQFLRCNHQDNRIQFAYGPAEQRNVDISFKIRATTIANATTATISPFFRSPHIPAWDTVAYQLEFKTYTTSLMYADRFADGNTLTTLAEYSDFGISVGLWNNVQISTRGERIVVYLNGDRILETIDTNEGEYGGFGFAARLASFDIDDLVITRHYGENLPEPSANERPLWMGDLAEEEEPDIADTGVPRIDLTNLGQNKETVNNAINYVDPTLVTTYTWILLAVAAACALAAVGGFVALILNKGGKRE